MNDRCESCGREATGPDDTGLLYDRSPEGQGRARLMTLCHPCGQEYLLTCWDQPIADPKPEAARARELGGAR